MKIHNYFNELGWMSGAYPAEWEQIWDESWTSVEEHDLLVDQAYSGRFIFITLGFSLLLAAPAIWAILSLV